MPWEGPLMRLKLVESKSYVRGYFYSGLVFIKKNHGQFHAMLITNNGSLYVLKSSLKSATKFFRFHVPYYGIIDTSTY